MLVIRLNRTGRRNRPFFRLVVQEKSAAPGGRHADIVGSWNPHKKEGVFKEEKILHWLEKGAQPSDSVHNLLVSQGVIKGPKRAIKTGAVVGGAQEPAEGDAQEKQEEGATEKVSKEEAPQEPQEKQEASKEEVKEAEAPQEKAKESK